jgi:uncharacterized membrane protein YqaE (UPF0057 family)
MKKLFMLTVAVGLFISSNAIESGETIARAESRGTNTTLIPDDIAIQHAMTEFKSLSRVDRKAKIAEVKKSIAAYKAQKATGEASTNKILLAILAIILPPLAVGLHEGALNGKFWLSVLLTLLFWIPGVIYALIVVL